MVPAGSDRVSRAPPYSGYRLLRLGLRVRGYHPLWPRFPAGSASPASARWRPYNPGPASTGPVWATPLSLAATRGITLVFFSSGYLDVSVLRVCLPACAGIPGLQPGGLPHSDTRGSMGMCPSPRIFAACRVLLRLWEPRHPPCALNHFPRARAPGVRSVASSALCQKNVKLVLVSLQFVALVFLFTPPPRQRTFRRPAGRLVWRITDSNR